LIGFYTHGNGIIVFGLETWSAAKIIMVAPHRGFSFRENLGLIRGAEKGGNGLPVVRHA
jgi:hypothetical protein